LVSSAQRRTDHKVSFNFLLMQPIRIASFAANGTLGTFGAIDGSSGNAIRLKSMTQINEYE
jgi:hypothetical protein